MKAASQIVRIVEDLLTSKKIQQCPIHIVPALFAAMGMHAIDICSGDVIREQLGNVKIRLSMIALRELKSTWPVSGWIFLLFTKIVRRIRDQGYLSLREEPAESSTAESGTHIRTNVHASSLLEEMPVPSNQPRSQAYEPLVSSGNDPIAWDASNSLIPFDLSADWNSAVNENLWRGSDIDFWMIPQEEGDIY